MKKFSLVFLFGVLAFSLSACVANGAVATSNAVQVPDALKVAINGLVLFGVTLGLQICFDKVGLDLRGIGVVIAGAVAEFAILHLQGLIDIVPAEFDIYVNIGLNVALAVLTSLGFFRAAFQRERAEQLL